MKKDNILYALLIIAILVTAGVIITNLIQENKTLKAHVPCLVEGERIEYFDLKGMDEQVIDESNLEEEGTSLIFIFSRPCSPCNRNIVFWNRTANILKDDVRVFGIILDDFSRAHDFSQSKKLHFNIYVPVDLNRFVEQWRLKLDLAQTVLYHDLQVKTVEIGDLNGQSFTEMVKAARRLTGKGKNR